MKKLLLLSLLSLLFTSLLFSQNQYEIGPRITDWTGFGMILKKELKNSNYLRIRTGSASLSLELNSNIVSSNAGLNIAVGVEKRIKINDDLIFLHGFEPRIFLSATQNADVYSYGGSIGLGYVLGLAYEIKQNWIVSIETIPGIDAFIQLRPSISYLGLRARGDINNIGIALTHRFQTSKK